MELDEEALAPIINHAEGMAAKAVHKPKPVRDTTIRVQDGGLVEAFWGEREKVPGHISIFAICLRVSLLRVDKVGKFDGIADEKDWRIVASHIPIALFSVELDGEASRVSLSVRRTLFSSDCRETNEDGGLFANLRKKFSLANFAQVRLSDFKVAVCTSTFGMHDSLRNPLTIKVGQLVNQMEVLQQPRFLLIWVNTCKDLASGTVDQLGQWTCCSGCFQPDYRWMWLGQ